MSDHYTEHFPVIKHKESLEALAEGLKVARKAIVAKISYLSQSMARDLDYRYILNEEEFCRSSKEVFALNGQICSINDFIRRIGVELAELDNPRGEEEGETTTETGKAEPGGKVGTATSATSITDAAAS